MVNKSIQIGKTALATMTIDMVNITHETHNVTTPEANARRSKLVTVSGLSIRSSDAVDTQV